MAKYKLVAVTAQSSVTIHYYQNLLQVAKSVRKNNSYFHRARCKHEYNEQLTTNSETMWKLLHIGGEVWAWSVRMRNDQMKHYYIVAMR